MTVRAYINYTAHRRRIIFTKPFDALYIMSRVWVENIFIFQRERRIAYNLITLFDERL